MSHITQCPPNTTLQQAAQLMKTAGCSALLVVDGTGNPVGTVTERDLLMHGLADGRDARLTIDRVMDRNIVTVGVDYRLPDIIDKRDFGDLQRIVIVNEKRKPVGLFRPQDLFGLLAQEFGNLAGPEEFAPTAEIRDDLAA